jgi:DNA phosphorothioation-dependent restriction protein DptG|tara:strand:- start:77 stop:322 length:246 start_codon:yes stop_codon:yes gene_type:complete
MMNVIMERYPYRYVEDGVIELNDKPDYRIQKFNEYTRRYNDMYLLDSSIQLDLALEDFEYTKWLDPAGVPCYQDTEKEHVS